MVSLFDLALDHLGGDLHRHTADLVLDLVDSLLALLRNVGLGLLLEGSGLCAGLAQQLFAAGGSRLLGSGHDLVGLGAGILQVLLVLRLHGLSLGAQLFGVRDLAVRLGLALGDDFFDRVQQQLFEDHQLDHQVADLGQKRPAIQRDQCLIKLHKRLPFLLKSSSERSAYCR